MERSRRLDYTHLDIKVPLGPLVLNVFYVNFEAPLPGWGYGNHSHSSYELHFVSTGRGQLRVGGQAYQIGPGSFYLTGPGVYHEQHADEVEPMDEFCINFEVRHQAPPRTKHKTYLPDEVDEIARTLARSTFWFGTDTFGTIPLFERVFDEFDRRWIGYYSAIQNLLSLILVNALRCFGGPVASPSVFPPRLVPDARRFLLDTYFQGYQPARSRAELARRIGTGIRQMNRILHDTYGLSFRQKAQQARMEQARHLLSRGETPETVARSLGYARATAFAEAYRRYEEAP